MSKLPPLIDIRNFRSLYRVGKVNGLRLPPQRFYRCASLHHASPEVLESLKNDYKVRLIIDLRTDEEVEAHPDPKISGVKNLHIPVMRESNNGVNRMGAKRPSYTERVATYQELEQTYQDMGGDPYSLAQYGKVVRACLDLEEGAVLWHCSAGKDRTGIVAFLLLRLFGYPMKDILNDYLLTNGQAKRFAWRMGFQAFWNTHDRAIAHKVWRISIASKRYLNAFSQALEKTCGSIEGYFHKYCGISEQDILDYRKRFLSKC